MLEIITNSEGSGDWVAVIKDNSVIHTGHDISLFDFKSILESLDIDCRLVTTDDLGIERYC